MSNTLKNMILTLTLVAAPAMIGADTVVAQRSGFFSKMTNRGCPQCEAEVCELRCEEGTEARTCFQVDYKTICIPKVTLPWNKCNPERCGEARSVKILKKHTFECPTCNYSWEVIKCDVPIISDPGMGGSPAVPSPADTTYLDSAPRAKLPQVSSLGITGFGLVSSEQTGSSSDSRWGALAAIRNLIAPTASQQQASSTETPQVLMPRSPEAPRTRPAHATQPQSYVVPTLPASSGTLTDDYFGGIKK